MRPLLLLSLALLANAPARAQDEYGGGWAVPSLDTAISITNEVGRQAVMRQILEKDLARKSGTAGSRPGRTASPALAAADTRFQRSAAVQRESEAQILAAVAKRQPGAVAEYRSLFAKYDIAKAFEDIVRPYGLSANDAADALAAYWVMGWIVANQAELPARGAVLAARNQVKQGLIGTGLAGMDARHRQQLADEAIFNMLVLNQAYRHLSAQGKLAPLAEATQKNFLALGADLRGLTLGPAGFAKR